MLLVSARPQARAAGACVCREWAGCVAALFARDAKDQETGFCDPGSESGSADSDFMAFLCYSTRCSVSFLLCRMEVFKE